MDLFEFQQSKTDKSHAPLSERLRPKKLEDFVGQEHLLGKNAPLRKMIESDQIPSMILWGPPGTGKTTLAHLIAKYTQRKFHFFSAVLSGVKEVREIIEKAKEDLKYQNKTSILFVDEIHRFNKAQQDAFLPHIENGTVTLIGATTENPSFEVISPLLSRTRVLTLKSLDDTALNSLLEKGLLELKDHFKFSSLEIEDTAKDFIIKSTEGDARRMLNGLEVAVSLLNSTITLREPQGERGNESFSVRAEPSRSTSSFITLQMAEEALQRKALLYDKGGEEHYNVISTFIKSMRGSDPDAAVYWLARMLEAGEDPLFVARRMVIFASEDVGNADPQAIQVAIAAMQAYDFVGMPEGWIPLAQAATYLASAPKSNASYMAYKKAKADLKEFGSLPTPLHLRNAPTKLMKELDYGKAYQYAHDYDGKVPNQQHLPDQLKEKIYYQPTDHGYEKEIRKHLEHVSKKQR